MNDKVEAWSDDCGQRCAHRVVQTGHLARFIEEFGLLITGRGSHIIPLWWLENSDNRHRVQVPENQSNIILSGQFDKLING